MGFRKDLKEMKSDIAEIKAVIAKDYVKKSDELKKIKEHLSHIELKVKSITDVIDYNGKPALKIIYEAPQVIVSFDDNNEAMTNETFRAINFLDLISFNDKLQILQKINKKD